MEFLTGMNIVLMFMNLGMTVYIHSSHLFGRDKKSYTPVPTLDDLDTDTSPIDNSKSKNTYFS